jgi:hypothetical protein
MIQFLKNISLYLKKLRIKKWTERNRKYRIEHLKKELKEILILFSGNVIPRSE